MDTSANTTTYEFHTQLNPVIWDGMVLKPEVREKLLQIAAAFIDYIEIDIDVEDITLTGSLANYNYTKYSDFDLHIKTDLSEYDAPSDLLKDYFKAKKTVWNTTRNITIKGHEVELYVENVEEPHYSTGVYSLKNNTWIIKPKPITSMEDVDKRLVLTKKKTMLDIINYALSPDCSVADAEKAKEKFLDMRKIGLEKGGEFSPENLAYKELRNTGAIEKLIQGVLAKKDAELSLNQENFKSYMDMSYSKERGPRHQGLTAGVNRAGKTSGTVGMVARMHTNQETPFPKVENLKKQKKGTVYLSPREVQGIASFYNLDLEKIKSRPEGRGLSTSGIRIMFNPSLNVYVLTK